LTVAVPPQDERRGVKVGAQGIRS